MATCILALLKKIFDITSNCDDMEGEEIIPLNLNELSCGNRFKETMVDYMIYGMFVGVLSGVLKIYYRKQNRDLETKTTKTETAENTPDESNPQNLKTSDERTIPGSAENSMVKSSLQTIEETSDETFKPENSQNSSDTSNLDDTESPDETSASKKSEASDETIHPLQNSSDNPNKPHAQQTQPSEALNQTETGLFKWVTNIFKWIIGKEVEPGVQTEIDTMWKSFLRASQFLIEVAVESMNIGALFAATAPFTAFLKIYSEVSKDASKMMQK